MTTETIETAEQPVLLAEAAPEVGMPMMADVDLIDVAEFGSPPSKALRESIKAYGVRQPVLIEESGERFYCRDGRRRVLAARDLKLDQIPALLVSGDLSYQIDRLTLHGTRQDNPTQELAAIEALIQSGKTESEVAKATGLPVQTIRKRLRLANLTPGLRQALDIGLLKITAAEACAKLPQTAQANLERLGEAGKRIKHKHIKEQRQAVTVAAQAAIPWEELDAPPEAPSAALPTWEQIGADATRSQLRDLLTEAMALMKGGRPGVGAAKRVKITLGAALTLLGADADSAEPDDDEEEGE